MNREPKILIITGSFGEGHNTAARNLRDAFAERGIEAEVLDFFAAHYPEISALLQKGYVFAINNTPKLWKQLYRLSDSDSAHLLSFNSLQQQFAQALEERKPTAVVSTFPFYSTLLAKLYPQPAQRPFRFHTVITDAISISAMWCKGEADRLYVIDERSKAVVVREGVPAERVMVTGFPIAFGFLDSVHPLLPPNQTRPRILYLPTTKRPHAKATLAALTAFCQQTEVHVTIVLGRHEKRLASAVAEMRMILPAERLHVLGWVTNVPQLLADHHVVITKAGGATVNEALGAQCPLILNYVVPGQEEGNAQLVQETNTGLRIHAPEELPGALRRLLCAEDAQEWQAMRANLRQLNRANAAPRIADCVLQD